MIEAAILWNEPNNSAWWDRSLDPDGSVFADMATRAAAAVRAAAPGVACVLGGASPIDPDWLARMRALGVAGAMDAVAVHGFPVDWNLWPLEAWPDKLAAAAEASGRPVWVAEAGAGSFGADEVQVAALRRTVELLRGRAARAYWYSLFDLPQNWGAKGRHREAEGSSYYRHFYTGLVRADGSPKPALDAYAEVAGELGLAQWFAFDDPRLEEAAGWMRRLGTRRVRTGMSWADSFRPGAADWFDRQMDALAEFDVALTFCLTPAHLGRTPHPASPPREPQGFADFCAWAVDRYANGSRAVLPWTPTGVPAPGPLDYATRKDAA